PITAKSGEGETTINLTINVVPDSLYWQWASDFSIAPSRKGFR
ncbi:MAG: hypothetical protein ACJAVK_002063, partial [Akkermansiaceae bacterium]